MSRIILIICIMCGTYNLSFCNAKLYFNLYINLNIAGLSDQNVYYNVTTIDGSVIINNTKINQDRSSVLIPLLAQPNELVYEDHVVADKKIYPSYGVLKLNIFGLQKANNNTVETIYIKASDLYIRKHVEIQSFSTSRYSYFHNYLYLGGSIQIFGVNDFDMIAKNISLQEFERDKPEVVSINVPFDININYSEDNLLDATSFEPKKYKGSYSGSYKIFHNYLSCKTSNI